ncbi:TIGR02281 family clan AA aspartic protease [Pseudoalteromonas sp. KG3]|jgi:clan AA aspartic protease (TIGR02281 family)|uniref:TIGR02281 family clan AA aspartic protease n=1 Tax=Pseudoalteromonas prydzensis TaxID=182141 RepID=A0ABR9FIP3_9GAMM|nr:MULTISPECIES: TIGR02281 family clan AA aspartic protease [Pseudoalteromonas]MBE0456667.1 TIGR02281 family clan AA aspartic protease [Pseudoalteromonas prydzensis]WKD22560.1 TIGR02281 family clan AA aspartic protease [Pseudoalteromonas sp. KG3]
MKRTFSTGILVIVLTVSIVLNGYLLWPTELVKPNIEVASQPQLKQPLANLHSPHYQQAIQYFNQQQFSAAVASYQQLQAAQPLQAEQLYFQWLNSVEDWLNDNQLTTAERFLHAFLTSHPYNVNMLQLDAERLVKNQQPNQAIVALLAIKPLANESQLVAINMRLTQLTIAQLKALHERRAWQTITEQTLAWLDYDNENPRFLFALAHAYYQLNDLASAQSSLDRLPIEHPLQSQTAALQTQINNAINGLDKIPLEKRGAHYLIDITINNDVNTQLMIDTGASFTVLPKQLLESLYPQPKYINNMSVNTANGQVNAEHYRVDTIKIGQQILHDFDILVINNHSGYGLLGMNFLQHFKFNINQLDNQLELEKQ